MGVTEVGARVRHRGSGDVGVVIEVAGGTVKVAFAAGIEYVTAADLEPLEPEPHELLAAGKLDEPVGAHLRLLARLIAHAYAYDESAALSNARLEPKLHQAFVAHRVVAQKLAPRMILADEVGLGKTIEAGLVLKELRARDLATRILVITPASLTRQWQSELRTKFNDDYEIMDGTAAAHLGRGSRNPFQAYDRIICSLPFATQPKRVEQILEADWDVVVFDEAHRVRRTGASPGSRRVTEAYRLADELRDQVHGLLLLSATPVQLHSYELYSLVELVEPGLFPSFEAFERNRASIPELNEVMRGLLEWESWTSDEKESFAVEHRPLLDSLGATAIDLATDEGRESVRGRLQTRHPLVDVLVRNRKSQLGLEGQRHAHVVPVQLSDAELAIYEKVNAYLRHGYRTALGQKNNTMGFLMIAYQKMLTSSSHALRTSLRRRIAKLRACDHVKKPRFVAGEVEDAEEISSAMEVMELDSVARLDHALVAAEISALEALVAELDEIRDSKVGAAIRLVQEQVHQHASKVVLFTQFVETQNFLARAFEANGLKVVTFNGTMSADEKEAAIHDFRQNADVLISTEAGGEGRNLQFANVLINYDLPWNPMKVEQRIGRLDRIGQARPVHIYNLVCQDTLDDRIIEVLDRRIRLFEESVGALDPILGEVEKDIQRLALEMDEVDRDRGFMAYGEDLERRVAQARLLERTLADFVLDRASFRRDEAMRLLGRTTMADPERLHEVLKLGLEYLGGSVLPHAEGGKVVKLSPRLASRLGVKETTWRGVFDPAEAVRMDELDFFACGHPLVDALLSSLGSLPDAVGWRRSRDVPRGVWVEVVRELSAELVVGQGRLVRHLVDETGRVVTSQLDVLPLHDTPHAGQPLDWFGRAVDVSEERFRDEYAGFREEMSREFEAIVEERRVRAKRIYESQRLRLATQIDSEQEWLDKRRHGASERDRKVIPAREGRLAKARERLSRLAEEHEVQDELIRGAELAVRARVVSAGVVEGVAQ